MSGDSDEYSGSLAYDNANEESEDQLLKEYDKLVIDNDYLTRRLSQFLSVYHDLRDSTCNYGKANNECKSVNHLYGAEIINTYQTKEQINFIDIRMQAERIDEDAIDIQ